MGVFKDLMSYIGDGVQKQNLSVRSLHVCFATKNMSPFFLCNKEHESVGLSFRWLIVFFATQHESVGLSFRWLNVFLQHNMSLWVELAFSLWYRWVHLEVSETFCMIDVCIL